MDHMELSKVLTLVVPLVIECCCNGYGPPITLSPSSLAITMGIRTYTPVSTLTSLCRSGFILIYVNVFTVFGAGI